MKVFGRTPSNETSELGWTSQTLNGDARMQPKITRRIEVQHELSALQASPQKPALCSPCPRISPGPQKRIPGFQLDLKRRRLRQTLRAHQSQACGAGEDSCGTPPCNKPGVSMQLWPAARQCLLEVFVWCAAIKPPIELRSHQTSLLTSRSRLVGLSVCHEHVLRQL